MRKPLMAAAAKLRQVRAKRLATSEKRAAFRAGYHSVLRELTEMARRSLRRRRYGDG